MLTATVHVSEGANQAGLGEAAARGEECSKGTDDGFAGRGGTRLADGRGIQGPAAGAWGMKGWPMTSWWQASQRLRPCLRQVER